ncbi:hypothetical protein QFC21_000170 [Naganishia friedmannii]|uniref:Uncharacterized protein n=1 Tax=Naganishia friedmannii TaxID=89922 RepID=A0ACC2WAR6_9TREE|nr:hypothetical protein QFC21_000170 [Naganishia friedmannii]
MQIPTLSPGSDGHIPLDTPTSDLFDFGSPTPSLISSMPSRPQFSLPLGITQSSDAKFSTSQESSSSRRWNSGSSNGSRKNVRTDGRSSGSSALYEDRNTRLSSAKTAVANTHANNDTKIKRPPAHYRHSTISAKSFASTLIETPALYQNMVAFPQTLEVSVEDEEGEAGPDRPRGYPSGDGAQFGDKQGGGTVQAVSASTIGKSVSEMKQKFETATREDSVRSNQQSLEVTMRPSLRKNFYKPKLSLKAVSLETTRMLANPPEPQVSKDITGARSNAKREFQGDLRGLGLGIPCLNQDSGTGASWQADMQRLEMSISEAESIRKRETLFKRVDGPGVNVRAVSELQTQLKPSKSSFSDSTEVPNRKAEAIGPSANEMLLGTESPRLVSKLSSARERETAPLSILSRTGSPFRETSKTAISPSQSILNLSQKGLASERRKLWEASSVGGGMGHTPLRLHKHSESNAPSRKAILGETYENERHLYESDSQPRRESFPSNTATPPIRNQAVKVDSRQPAYAGKQTSQQYNVDVPSDKIYMDGSWSVNLPPEPLIPSRSFGHISIRKPMPSLMASVSEGFQRSPSHTSSFKDSVTTLPVSALPPTTGRQTSVHQMKRTLCDAGLSPSWAAKTADANESRGVKDVADEHQVFFSSDDVPYRRNNPTKKSSDLLGATPDRQSTTSEWALGASAGLKAISEPTALNSPSRPELKPEAHSNRHVKEHLLANAADEYRETHFKDSPKIQESTFHQAPPDTSYFNYRTGVDLSANSIPDHTAPFSLAKTYTDWDTPLSSRLYAIPMSPDMNGGGNAPTATNRLYSSSPLGKSPGKRFVGKMVDVAKKAVPAGMKNRAGNLNRFMSNNDRLSFGSPITEERLLPKQSPAISQAPSMVERQEAQSLQPHWGNEMYGTHGTAMWTGETINAFGVDQDVASTETPKERELPPIPQGQVVHVEDMAADADSVEGARLWTTQEEFSHGLEKGCETKDPELANAGGAGTVTVERPSHVEHLRADLSPIPEHGEGPQDLLQLSLESSGPTKPAGHNRGGLLKDVQSVQDERGLSVFRTRQAMMRQPGRLTTPAPLSQVIPTGVDVLPWSKMVAPVMIASLQSPMTMANEEPRQEIHPLRQPRPVQQTAPTMENGIGQGVLDTSPTKTERLRKVADWAQGAAIAPPPPANDPQNASQEAALYRDEDRLDIRTGSPPTDLAFSPIPHASRVLPSIPTDSPWISDPRKVSDGTIHGPEDRLLEADMPVAEAEANVSSPSVTEAILERSYVPEPLPAQTLMDPKTLLSPPKSLTPLSKPLSNEEVDARVAMSPDVVVRLNEIRAEIQSLQQSTDATQLDGTFKEALMQNKDQTGDILAKTDIVLGIMKAIEEKLESFPQVSSLELEEQAATGQGHITRRLSAVKKGPDRSDPSIVNHDGFTLARDVNAEHRLEQNVEASSGTADDALNEQIHQLAISLSGLQTAQRESSESQKHEQSKLTGCLDQLYTWTHDLQQQISNDMLGLQQNMGGVLQATGALHNQNADLQRELGIRSPGGANTEEMQSLDLRSRLDHLTGVMSDILATSDTQGVVAGRMDRVIEALGVIQSKPDPLIPITTEEMTAIVERENQKHVDLLRSIAIDLVKDMQSERSRMVQEVSAATAVEVQRHVTHMTAQLDETRQELERLQIQRKETEETIADLLRLQSRYKGPASPPMSQPRPMAHVPQGTPHATFPGAFPMPTTPNHERQQAPTAMLTPSGGRVSTRPLPTPSLRPLMH